MNENRRRTRVKLRYSIQLSRPNDPVLVSTETDDLSSTGFYCTSDEPFSPGEHLICDLVIPAYYPGNRTSDLVLHRRVRVVRVEIKGLEPGFGIACEFEDTAPMAASS